MRRCLGRPTVGGRLTADAACHAVRATQGLWAVHRTCSRGRRACEPRLLSLSCLGRCQHRITVLRTAPCIAQTRAMRSVSSFAAAVAVAAPARSGSSSGSGQGQASAPASSVAASISARATAAPRFETRTAVAGSARLASPAAPALLDSAQRDAAGARDADVTLLTAMLARLSRNAADGQAAQSSATIGALLARCEARSAEDPAGAIKCRQELCADDRASLAACLTPPNGRAR